MIHSFPAFTYPHCCSINGIGRAGRCGVIKQCPYCLPLKGPRTEREGEGGQFAGPSQKSLECIDNKIIYIIKFIDLYSTIIHAFLCTEH